VFDYLGTSDFELVMRMLRHAYYVNLALDISEDLTDGACNDLKVTLIEAVRAIHIEHDDSAPHLTQVYKFMSRYNTVLSLNYDLTVYWSMLLGNEEIGGNWFKDCWGGGAFDGDWGRFRQPIGVDGTTLVFYPNGNLILATSLTGGEVKLSVSKPYMRLLGKVISTWEAGEYLPLFVSEGESKQKLAAISRSG